TSNTSNRSARMFHTGFQYTPVDSMATWITPHSPSPPSQSASCNKSSVKVPKRRFSFRLFPFVSAHNTHAGILFLLRAKHSSTDRPLPSRRSFLPHGVGRLEKAKISYACSPQLPEVTIRCASQRPSHTRTRALRAPE